MALQLAERFGRLSMWLDARTFADEAAYEYRVERWWALTAAAVREAMRAAKVSQRCPQSVRPSVRSVRRSLTTSPRSRHKAQRDFSAYVGYALELLPREMPGSIRVVCFLLFFVKHARQAIAPACLRNCWPRSPIRRRSRAMRWRRRSLRGCRTQHRQANVCWSVSINDANARAL